MKNSSQILVCLCVGALMAGCGSDDSGTGPTTESVAGQTTVAGDTVGAITLTETSTANGGEHDSATTTVTDAAGMTHQINIAEDDVDPSAAGMDVLTITDTTRNAHLTVTYDPSEQHATLTDGANSLQIDVQTDGSVMINGQAAATIAAATPIVRASTLATASDPALLDVVQVLAQHPRATGRRFRLRPGTISGAINAIGTVVDIISLFR